MLQLTQNRTQQQTDDNYKRGGLIDNIHALFSESTRDNPSS
jgi:hypothetical protein